MSSFAPIFIFILSCLLCLALTPLFRLLAGKVGAVDCPNSRKVHDKPIARFGGPAITLSLVLSLAACSLLFPAAFARVYSSSPEAMIGYGTLPWLVPGLLLVLALGVWDDLQTLEPAPKFLIQILAALLVYLAGFQITITTNPFGPGSINLAWLSLPVTLLWIIGVTNAFNLIDGLDGLATGVALIALGTMGAVAVVHGETGIVLSAAVLGGTLIGFLYYNFRPASIFLGDSGSLFLGFLLAILSIESYMKVSTTFAILVPVFALGLPIADTLLSMCRRFFSWFVSGNPNQEHISFRKVFRSIFQPDKSHVHHRLISKGLSHRNTVLVLWAVALLFGIFAFAVAVTDQVDTTVLLLILLAAFLKNGIARLRYREMDLLHNGIFYTVYNSLVINRRHFRKVLDVFFILGAFTLSLWLTYPDESGLASLTSSQLAWTLGLVFVLQTGTFLLTGVYRETIRRLGIADVFSFLKSIFVAVMLTATVHYLFLREALAFRPLFYVLDFYFLATLTLGMRVSFHLLKYFFHKSRDTKRRVLIHGAGDQGLLALHRLLNIDSEHFNPVGFLDENPSLEGKRINGYPIYGGHWKLERLISTKNIDELHLAQFPLPREVYRRIRKIAQEHDLKIRRLDVQLKNLQVGSAVESLNNEMLENVN